jgi:uncharacterized protein YrrD
MLRSVKNLEGYAIHATDGIIGHVEDFYFDDTAWVIRYLVVDTGEWLSGRRVLISPMSIGKPNWPERSLNVALTKKQVMNSPDIDTKKPVSRQQEINQLAHYGYPFYWGGPGAWGWGAYPDLMMAGAGPDATNAEYQSAQAREVRAMVEEQKNRHEDPHQRSCREVLNYHIDAIDGDIGHVQGFLFDDQSWSIRYLVVDTNNWWLDHEVLVAPQWIGDVSWLDATVSVNLTRQAVKEAPPYDSTTQLDREQESDIYLHYGRTGYWATEAERDAPVPHRQKAPDGIAELHGKTR